MNALSFLATIAIARLLVPADVGLVALGITILALTNALTSTPVSLALIHKPDVTEQHLYTVWTVNAVRGAIIFLVMVAGAQPLSMIFNEPRLAGVVSALGLCVAIGGLANPKRILLQKSLVFWQDFALTVSQQLVGVIVSICYALLTQSYWALVFGELARQVTGVAMSYLVLPMRPRFGTTGLKELFGFSGWLSLSQFVNTLNWRFDQLLIGRFLGSAPLGLYSIGDRIAALPTQEALAPLTQTLFPAFTQIASDRGRLRAAFVRAQTVATMIALPLGIGLALVSEPLVHVLLGPKWSGAAIVIQALASIFALQTIGTLAQPLCLASGQTRLLFARDLQMLVVRVPIIAVGMFLAGLEGVLLARVASGTIAILVNMALIRRLLGLAIGAQILANARSLTSAALMAISVFAAQRALASAGVPEIVLLIACIAIGGVAYVAALACLWLLSGRPDGPEREISRIARRFLPSSSPS